ncbi:DNA-binding WRKY [Macleaya cordata]|uniref:DNA-binding WRKY n=1 Tax=Macleaya cordata TaxID=56857 RepID=A0A200R2S6_MACCD|nr:DNA-binding WRKY [Macleaya cordata]
MADSIFLARNFNEENPKPNPNPNYTYLIDNFDLSDFEVSDYLLLDRGISEDDSTSTYTGCDSTNPIIPAQIDDPVINNSSETPTSGAKKTKMDVGFRIAFRTKSELEILDDGFKWRKYGKKAVKNNPNPRNYYRCSTGGCNVKKKVERDGNDSSYVITTYEGVHNHESPSVVYYNEIPLMVPSGWTLQASHSHSSSF